MHNKSQIEPATESSPDGAEVDLRAIVDQLYPSLTALLSIDSNRRRFMQLMGASLGLAGLNGCRWPREEILPYADQPQGRTPGVPVAYATAMELAGAAVGLLVTSYDGRPIKIEGNPLHPASLGKTNAWQQASILELYDPDRSTQALEREQGTLQARNWNELTTFANKHFSLLRNAEGAGLAIVTEASSSPSEAFCKRQLHERLPRAQWFEFEPLSREAERDATRQVFGRPLRPLLDMSQVQRIVSLDCDWLMHHPQSLTLAGEFAQGRRGADGKLNRLVVFESNYTVTGSMADDRYPIPSAQISSIAQALLAHIAAAAEQFTVAHATATTLPAGPLADAISKLAEDLWQHRGTSLIVTGDQQPTEVHAIAHRLNVLLGNIGNSIRYVEPPDAELPACAASLVALKRGIDAEQVESLLILGGNPVVAMAEELRLGEAIARVPTSIHLSLYANETSQQCTWHLPQAHYLESWCDVRGYDGTYSIVQPLIEPLYDGKTTAQVLSWLADGKLSAAYDLTRQSFVSVYAASSRGAQSEQPSSAADGAVDVEAAWRQTLHDGLLASSAWPQVTVQLAEPRNHTDNGDAQQVREAGDSAVLANDSTQVDAAAMPFEINFVPDYSLHDGRFANNAWLQELPDPITKLTWDNAALMSKFDAKGLGIRRAGEIVRIEHGGKLLEIPAFPLAGHARGSISIAIGYGRHAAGVVGNSVGTNVRALLPLAGRRLTAATVTVTGQTYPLVTSQDQPAMQSLVGDAEKERRVKEELVRVATIDQFNEFPEFAKSHVHEAPLWQAWSYEDGHKWGLAVDLSACIGCGGCVVACQAENNVPVVGKQEVGVGRIMHWLRVDRYVQDTSSVSVSDTPWPQAAMDDGQVRVLQQPMTCHQCESAPCEQVCPVAATVHDQEGLSVMVYSRCIGTRYCNNNCPFRVRRFNWFWNQHGPHHPRSGQELTPVEQMVHNPNVTVRSRGVMEKCSFCSQRINAAKIEAKNEGQTRIADGVITPACAQACPTQAIVFGDLNDPQSRVRKLHEDARAYSLLPELNLKPRLMYLAKLINPSETSGLSLLAPHVDAVAIPPQSDAAEEYPSRPAAH